MPLACCLRLSDVDLVDCDSSGVVLSVPVFSICIISLNSESVMMGIGFTFVDLRIDGALLAIERRLRVLARGMSIFGVLRCSMSISSP